MVSMSSLTTSLAQWIAFEIYFWFLGWTNHVAAPFDDLANPREPNRMPQLSGEC